MHLKTSTKILLQFWFRPPSAVCVWTVGPGQCDLESLVSCDEGRKPGQTLLPRAPNSDQQGVPLWRPQNSGDPHQMGHCVLPLEQTQVCGRYGFSASCDERWQKSSNQRASNTVFDLEEDQVHGSASHRLIVLLLEHRQPLRQDLQRGYWLIYLSIMSILH